MSGTLNVEAHPLGADEFACLLDRFVLPDGPIGIAVSGGPDSMALAFCLKRWAQRPLFALIVDHGLRNGSSAEATNVKTFLDQLDIRADILKWDHDAITARLHEKARAARYALLTAACCHNGLRQLMTAHHRDDQAETVLMRLAKGSGVEGLSGMAEESERAGIRILRPFLTLSKQRLMATCVENNIPFVTDPSNQSPKFARGRLRKVMPLLAEEGLTTESLLRLGARAAEVSEALDYYTKDFLVRATSSQKGGVVYLDRVLFASVPRAIALRALAHCLRFVHPDDHPPEHDGLCSLSEAIREEGDAARTFYGCIVSLTSTKVTFLREESGALERLPLKAGQTVLWDKRWAVTAASEAPETMVAALGNQTHAFTDALSPLLRRQIPQGRVRASLPALWVGNKLEAIPSFEGTGMFSAVFRKQTFP